MSHTPLDAIKISQELASTYPRVKVIAETTSTQTEISKLFTPLAPFDLLIAEHQTHGRGRLDRTFSAPPHSALLFSLYLEPVRPKNLWGMVPLIMGASVARGINSATGLSTKTKWPNDILVNERKICGILCEVKGNGIIAGIGINVNITGDELPVPSATSIALEAGEKVNREEIMIAVCHEIYTQFNEWNQGVSFRDRYEAISATLGKTIRVTLLDGSLCEGIASGITDEGELVMESGESFSVGDVTHLR